MAKRISTKLTIDPHDTRRMPESHRVALGVIVDELTGMTNVYLEEKTGENLTYFNFFQAWGMKESMQKIGETVFNSVSLEDWIKRAVEKGLDQEVRQILESLGEGPKKDRYRKIANDAKEKRKQSKISTD